MIVISRKSWSAYEKTYFLGLSGQHLGQICCRRSFRQIIPHLFMKFLPNKRKKAIVFMVLTISPKTIPPISSNPPTSIKFRIHSVFEDKLYNKSHGLKFLALILPMIFIATFSTGRIITFWSSVKTRLPVQCAQAT